MDGQELMQKSQSNICSTYTRYNLAITRGSGCYLWGQDGREYLDLVAGIAVCNLGHCPPDLSRILHEQAQQLVHVSNLYYTEPQVRLAESLTQVSFADKAFFCNSGAEANEAAIKLARKYSRERYGSGRYTIITMKDSFHGRTLATLSATGQEKVQIGFEPLVEGFRYVEFNRPESVADAIDETTCAVLVEPIQGEGGVRVPDPDYLAGLRQLCTKHDLLLIYDEIQVGMGRTGKLFAHQHEGVAPDVMTLAKALANGIPIGTMLATNQAAEAFSPGSHATTFGGTPLVTAVANEVLHQISDDSFLDGVRGVGEYFRGQLQALQEKYAFISEVRGRGLILGMELDFPGSEIVLKCQEHGVLINCTAEKVLRFLPPLIVTQKEVDRLVETLDIIFAAV
ncbi:MAG: aspartate aminotransferase family protein [Deltaproteobacteria bacterium]|nr:MAG: aspartate aminotransferase family protein [Deltaproteobacteria bacterium]